MLSVIMPFVTTLFLSFAPATFLSVNSEEKVCTLDVSVPIQRTRSAGKHRMNVTEILKRG
jgi:hypothetical protein